MIRFILPPLALLLATGITTAQEPAKAESSSSSSASSSCSHRVVVVNGKTIVDEKIVDGIRMPGSQGGGAVPPPFDAEARMREMQERMRKMMNGAGNPLGGASSSSSSSHTRRVVVRNGVVEVDEETRDGKPVRPGDRKSPPTDRSVLPGPLPPELKSTDWLRRHGRGTSLPSRDSKDKASLRPRSSGKASKRGH